MERLIGGEVPRIGFFHMTRFTIAGLQVRGIRHGMAGQPGFELFGAWGDADRVLEAILEAGAEHGLVRVGAKGYSTANLESGMGALAPAGDLLRRRDGGVPALAARDERRLARRQLRLRAASRTTTSRPGTWTTAGRSRSTTTSSGAMRSSASPRDRTAGRSPSSGTPTTCAASGARCWMTGCPRSTWTCPSRATRSTRSTGSAWATPSSVSPSTAATSPTSRPTSRSRRSTRSTPSVGTEVTVTWGEDPVSQKPQVEPHRQVEVRATVAPWPYVREAREHYRSA